MKRSDEDQAVLAAHPEFRIFFTADPRRPSAKRLSQAFLDRCSTIHCLSFDKEVKRAQKEQQDRKDISDYLEQMRTLPAIQSVAKSSEPRADAFLQLHARMVRKAPNSQSYMPRLVCGVPVNGRTFKRMLWASEVFQDSEVPLRLAYGDALLETAAPGLLRNIQLCAEGVPARSETYQLQILAQKHVVLQGLCDLLKNQPEPVTEAQVHSVLPPELVRLSFSLEKPFLSFDVCWRAGLKIRLLSATLVLRKQLHAVTGHLRGVMEVQHPFQGDQHELQRKTQFFVPVPLSGKLIAAWVPSLEEDSLPSSFVLHLLQTFIGAERLCIFPEARMLPSCQRVNLSVRLPTSQKSSHLELEACILPHRTMQVLTPSEPAQQAMSLKNPGLKVKVASDSVGLDITGNLLGCAQASCSFSQKMQIGLEDGWAMKMELFAVMKWQVLLQWTGSSPGEAAIKPGTLPDIPKFTSLERRQVEMECITLEYAMPLEAHPETQSQSLELQELLQPLLHSEAASVVHAIIGARTHFLKQTTIASSALELLLLLKGPPDASTYTISSEQVHLALQASSTKLVYHQAGFSRICCAF